MQKPQKPLEQGDFVYVKLDKKGVIPAELRDIFANEALVALKGQSNELMTVCRSKIARIDYGPFVN